MARSMEREKDNKEETQETDNQIGKEKKITQVRVLEPKIKKVRELGKDGETLEESELERDIESVESEQFAEFMSSGSSGDRTGKDISPTLATGQETRTAQTPLRVEETTTPRGDLYVTGRNMGNRGYRTNVVSEAARPLGTRNVGEGFAMAHETSSLPENQTNTARQLEQSRELENRNYTPRDGANQERKREKYPWEV